MEDEAVCIGALLDTDIGGIISRSEGVSGKDLAITRFRLLLQQMGDLPSYVLFANVARMTERGFRWAPTSAMRGGETDSDAYFKPAETSRSSGFTFHVEKDGPSDYWNYGSEERWSINRMKMAALEHDLQTESGRRQLALIFRYPVSRLTGEQEAKPNYDGIIPVALVIVEAFGPRSDEEEEKKGKARQEGEEAEDGELVITAKYLHTGKLKCCRDSVNRPCGDEN
ncbi:hypothetical protein BU16DRAFT_566682 [Lophium mytilinum]|uniref:Uncharacterized protein n=1 Tax=Lophium mytilinum TaxID=390894 RepID=A0A6A6QBW1_9PEZI|nr:hypothetical protein BU16DRAFT_566682 [Lophium mytilinum]